MAEINASDYFAKRQQQALQAEDTAQARLADVQTESAIELKKFNVETAARAKQEELNKKSWVGKAGLDPEGVVGQVANLGANVYSGVNRAMGAIGALPESIMGVADLAALGDKEIEAINRYKAGTATQEDVDLITSPMITKPPVDNTPEAWAAARMHAEQTNAPTPLQRFERSTANRKDSTAFREAFDRSDVVHSEGKNALSQSLEQGATAPLQEIKDAGSSILGGDVSLSNVGKVLKGVARLDQAATEAARNNPMAVAGFAAENAPQLLMGAGGVVGRTAMAADNASYGFDAFEKGIEKFSKENGGQLPDEATQRRMAGYAAAAVAAEQLGDKLMLGAGKVKDAVKGAAKEIAKKTGANASLDHIAKAAVESLVTEGGTEAFQTFAEGEAGLDPATGEKIFAGGVIGALSGAALSGGLRTAAEVTGATPEKAEARQKVAEKNEALDAAIASGDVTALTDPKNVAYAPEKAVAALYGNSKLDTATPETKQANLEKASEIVADLEAKQTKAQEAYATVSPEGVQGYKDQLVKAKAANDAETVALLTEQLDSISKDPKAVSRLETQLSKFDRQLTEARKNLTNFNEEVQAKAVDVDAQIAAINAKVDAQDPAAVAAPRAAADTLINLSMAVPERLDPTVASELAANTSNGLSDTQRTYLRAFSEARIAENKLMTMGAVSQRVFTGKDRDVGISQYRSRVAEALAGNNKPQAERHLADLVRFEADHKAKAQIAEEAWAQGKGTQIVRAKDRTWQIATEKLSDAARQQNGGLTVNSEGLVSNIRIEADALTKAVAELQSAVAVKFSSTPKVVKDVKNVPQTRPGTTTSAPAADKTSKAVGSNAEAAPAVSAAGRVPAVEAVGVKKNESTEETAVDQVAHATESDKEGSVASNQSTESITSNAVAVDKQAQQESAEQTSEVAQENDQTPVADAGKLDIFTQKSAEGTEYALRNLIADYFSQTASREGDSTKRPLVAAKNFVAEALTNALDYLQIDELSDNQQQVIRTFQAKAALWAGNIQKNLLRKANPKFYSDDMVQFLLQGEGNTLDLEENVKTAMSYAAFSWIAENAARSAYNTDEEINLILGREEDAQVSQEERNVLLNAGTRQNLVANALGQRAAQALGLKASKDAPVNLMPKLESALGAHILKMLMDQGILVRSTVSGTDMARMTQNEATDTNAVHQFIKLDRDADRKLSPQAAEIFEASKGTQGVLDKLFSVESGLKEPSLVPVPFSQAKTRNTNQNVPEKLAKIIEHENSVPSYVRQDMWQLITQLDENVALQMAGAESVSADQVHAANIPSRQAKNDGLLRELTRFKDYVGSFLSVQPDDLETPVYFEHSVWKQQRVGIATNAINPQTSKIHRHMLFRKTWDTKVARNDAAQMDNFHLRVLEGLGVKTDKQSNEKSLSQWEEKVNTPVIQDAVKVLRKAVFQGGITAAEQQTLLAGVKAGGQNFHSLDALMALAQEAEAGDKDFNVQLMGEVDGVTNGPMLSHLLMGAASTVQGLFSLLNRGGFFEEGNEHNQYNLWREAAGHLDLYETTIKNVLGSVKEMGKLPAKDKLHVDLSVLASVYAFTGELETDQGDIKKDGRNIIKTPLTAMVFGSSVGKAIESMADKFVESVYAKIEDLAAGKGDRAEVIGNLRKLGVNVNPKATVEQLLKTEFAGADLDALKKSFKSTMGKAVKWTMEEDFADFITQRKQFNLAAQMTFELYNAAQTGMREAYVAELVKAGEIAVNETTKKPLHDLNAKQVAELNKRLRAIEPVMHTAMSKDSGSLNAGLRISKTTRKLSTNPAFKGEIKFGTKFSDTGAASTSTSGFETVEAAPGVAMAPMSVHSTDSAISHNAADGNEVLNVHDAHGAGLGTFEQTARNLNKATWDAMLGYSPAAEMMDALSRTVMGLASLVQEESLPPAVIENLANALKAFAKKHDMEPASVLSLVFQDTKNMAYHADDMKLQALGLMASIDQYALEGGNYAVTDADRQKAASLREALSNAVSEKETEALTRIESLLGDAVKGETTQQAVDPEEDLPLAKTDVLRFPPVHAMQLLEHGIEDKALTDAVREDMRQVLAAMVGGQNLKDAVLGTLGERGMKSAGMVSLLAKRFKSIPSDAWGDLGTSTMSSDPELVALFETGGSVTAGQVLQNLYSRLNAGPETRTKAFNIQLVKILSKTVNPSLQIRYVTQATAPEMVLEKPASKARGWYVAKGTAEEIYVLSNEFVHSGLTVETLLHELTHSALARTVEQELQAKKVDAKYTSEALDLINDLEALRAKALEHTKKEKLDQFGAALSNVHEFITWGMTNQDFQRNVLNKITMQSKTKKNTLVKGMKAFIDSLVGLLFKGSDKSRQAQTVNGMSILVGNVSGLFAAAAKSKTAAQAHLNLAQASDPMAQVRNYGTLDILSALNGGNLTGSFESHLQDVTRSIVNKLHGPFGVLKDSLMKNQAITPLDVWQKAMDTGEAPFASEVLANMAISEKEAFTLEQVEVTMRAALSDKSLTTLAYKELSKLYTEVHAKLKPTDFNSQAEYDFVFGIEKNEGDRSDYLARFAALGLAHQGFNNLLKVATDRDTKSVHDGKTFGERVQILFENILAFFHGKVTHTYAGQQADQKLEALVGQLVDIEAKKRHTLARRATELNMLGPVEEGARKGMEALRAKVGEIAGSDWVRKNSSGIVAGAGGLIRTVANDQVEYFLEGMAKLRDREFKGRPGMVAGLINQLRGPKEWMNTLLLASKNHERERKTIITNRAGMALKAFADEGKGLGAKAKAGISAVLLRTGMHTLVDHFSMAELENLLGDKAAQQAAIDKFEAQLNGTPKFKSYFVQQANVLAYYKATGRVKGAFTLMNAHNIANLYGTPYQARITEEQAQSAEEVIEVLVSLYALGYSSSEHLSSAKEVLRTENQRTDGNGAEFVLKLHKRLEEESRERLFGGKSTLMIHGYTPEIYNPHTEIKTATDAEGEELMAMGYAKGALVASDPADPTKSEAKHIYVLRDGGLQPYLTGIISMTGKAAKGSTQHSGYMNVNTLNGLDNAALQAHLTGAKQPDIQSMFKPAARVDLTKEKQTFMAPVLNENGGVVNWRYLMQESAKDDLLERDNRFDKILGALAGSIYDKETTKDQNRNAIEALREQYEADYATNSEAYVMVGPKSEDASIREIWALLPDETRNDVRQIWHKDSMMVKSDTLDVMFGYRKLSLADSFKKDPAARGHLEKLFVGVMEFNLTVYARAKHGLDQAEAEKYAKRAAVVVIRGERAWQELVRETKDIIVVKTGMVMLGNIWSNFSLLALSGVSIRDMVANHLVALKGATAYQQDSEELRKYQTMLDTDYTQGNDAEIKRNILRLEDALARNPVKELIDAGLMPTIVEDLAAEDDIYSYKSAMTRRIEKVTDKMNPKVVGAARLVYMTHDTKMYQGLSRITQLSDFVARYTLYQHLISRRNRPLSKAEAVQEASENFVNYDIPLHRGLQYTDDMGITMFTKYFLRIQRVLLKLGRENPARVLMTVALSHFLDLGPIVLEGSGLTRIGNNPLEWGAFQFPGTLDELATVKSAMALIK